MLVFALNCPETNFWMAVVREHHFKPAYLFGAVQEFRQWYRIAY
jgi:hypothetical protein